MRLPPNIIKSWQAITRVDRSTNRARTQSVTKDYIVRNFLNVPPCVEVPYNLEDIVNEKYDGRYINAEQDMCEYVSTIIKKPVKRDRAMAFVPHVSTIPTTDLRKPDCNLMENGATIFICEMESSNDWSSTILKLAIQLCQMLASLRNRNGCNAINSLDGFFFPKETKRCVVEVTVEWSDVKLKFIETHSNLNRGDVDARLRAVYVRNKHLWHISGWNHTEVYNYPIGSEYLRSKFGDTARQVESGNSVVIDKVFKKPINVDEQLQLFRLVGKSHPQIGFPIAVQIVGGVEFFTFRVYSPPVSVAQIQQSGVWYTEQLVNVVKLLHQCFNLAHLDIKRDNICVNSNLDLVLVDLDRSYTNTEVACNLLDDRIKHLDWTLEQVDWLQVGYLLTDLFPRLGADPFLVNLINEGEIQFRPF